jgi:hypothetical protein
MLCNIGGSEEEKQSTAKCESQVGAMEEFLRNV